MKNMRLFFGLFALLALSSLVLGDIIIKTEEGEFDDPSDDDSIDLNQLEMEDSNL